MKQVPPREPPAHLPRIAMILAAGRGERMRPITDHVPKPLVPVAGKTLLHRAVEYGRQAGMKTLVVNAAYKSEKIIAFLEGEKDVVISREETPLETGGGIRHALPLLGEGPFFSINSDVICLDGALCALHRLANAWDETRMDALLLLHPVFRAVGYSGPGDFAMAADGTLTRRREGQVVPFVFTGIQLLHPRLFKDAPDGVFSMNKLYNRGIGENGVLPRTFGIAHDGAWLHVGDPTGLAQAELFLR